MTGIGGGTLRDLLIGAGPVFWIGDPRDVLVCILVAAATFSLGPRRIGIFDGGKRGRALLWADALGLALFAVMGPARRWRPACRPCRPSPSEPSRRPSVGSFAISSPGTTPLVLRQEIYVTAAALGAAVMVGLIKLGFHPFNCATAGFAAAFTLRALALLRGWSLPAFPRRD